MSAAQKHYLKPTRESAEAFFVETWYNRQERSWVTQLLDANLEQIDEATYTGNTDDARVVHKWTIDAILHKHCQNRIPYVTEKLK